MMLKFSLRSLWNRRFIVGLIVLAIGLSVALILGVERLRTEARNSFANSASGIDLIVASRGNSVQILLATVFGVGGTGSGMKWESFEWLENRPEVAWAVPVQMGDNHRGFPVLGTTPAFFERFRHSGGQPLVVAEGVFFATELADRAVLGSDVAARFGYAPGTVIINAHGSGAVSFDMHDDAPFTVSGVLAPTGTAVDRMVFVTLEGFDAIHAQEEVPMADPLAAVATSAEGGEDHHDDESHEDQHEDAGHQDHADHGHEPDQINAVYVGLTDRTSVLGLQRAINERTSDPLSAVLPGVALAELWGITGTAETVMRLMAWAVALSGMIGLVVMLSATLDTRRREFAILRSVGATPPHIFGLIVTEAALLTGAGLVLGLFLLAVAISLAGPVLFAHFGLRLGFDFFGAGEIGTLAVIFYAGLVASLIPAVRVYQMTLADGLSVR